MSRDCPSTGGRTGGKGTLLVCLLYVLNVFMLSVIEFVSLCCA